MKVTSDKKTVKYKGIGLVQLGGGMTAVIDKEDIPLIKNKTWTLNSRGYAQTATMVNGRLHSEYMHRLIMGHPKKNVDHINRNKTDNRKSNLRLIKQALNVLNVGANKNSTSKYKGVSKKKTDNLYCARIQIKGKTKKLGYFKTEEEAASAYNKASKKYHGKYGYLNVLK